MHAILSKRHKASCPHKDDKHYRRCRCSIWIETNSNGVQTRKTTKTANWEDAQDKARAIEKAYPDAALGRGPAPSKAKTLETAIQLFMDSKRGENLALAENTLYTHTLNLDQLRDFCERHGVFFVNDITLSPFTSWRAAWPFESPLAKRNNQGGSNPFSISAMPAESSSPTPPGSSQPSRSKRMKPAKCGPLNRRNTRPCLPLPKSGLMLPNQAWVKAYMQLQPWAGLSLVDAVCLSKDELLKTASLFRARPKRRKTGAPINQRGLVRVFA